MLLQGLGSQTAIPSQGLRRLGHEAANHLARASGDKWADLNRYACFPWLLDHHWLLKVASGGGAFGLG